MNLKPCPFCGSKRVVLIDNGDHYSIICPKCEVLMNYSTELDAITAWNTRVYDGCIQTLKMVRCEVEKMPHKREIYINYQRQNLVAVDDVLSLLDEMIWR